MAAKNNNEISALRANYESEIRAREEEILALKGKISRLDEFEKDRVELLTVPTDKYRNEGMKSAALDAVKVMHQIGAAGAEGVTAREVANFMIAHGFVQAQRKHYFSEGSAQKLERLRSSGALGTDARGDYILATAVHVTLDRLAAESRSGIIVHRKQHSKYFRPCKIMK